MKDKILDIIETLCKSTENGDLKWSDSDPASNKRAYHRYMVAEGEDGTKFEMEVKYSLINEQWLLESEPSLWIKNTALPGGLYFVHGLKYNLGGLRDLIKENYCSDMNPSIKDVENIMDSIRKNISVSTLRENKINKFLGGE